MAAIVTTPTAVPGLVNVPMVPSSSLLISKVFADAMHIVLVHITAPGVKHLVVAPPVMRWNGTAWVALYQPNA